VSGIGPTSKRTIGRLSLYRRLLKELQMSGTPNVYSHQLANIAGVTAAQVRRDFMVIGYSGSPTRGYDIQELTESIANFLDAPEGQAVALVGIGNLGRAILTYFGGRRPKLSIVAAFDKDPSKVNRVIHGCLSYPIEELAAVAAEKKIQAGIITVPASEAQAVTDQLVRAGVRGILNFAPAPLRAPADTYVEDIDMAVSLEKVAYFARQSGPRE